MQKIKRILNRIIYIILFIFVLLLIIESEPIISNFLAIKKENNPLETATVQEMPKEQAEEYTEEVSKFNNIDNDLIIEKSIIEINNDKLNIIFFDVGQADSTLIICNGQTLLIDAGNTYDGKKLVKGIKELGIEKIDYVIGTHAHEDHLGGMSYIINNFDIGKLFMPKCSSNEFSFYSRLTNSLSDKNIPINKVEVGDELLLGNAVFEIMGVRNDEPEDINESSIILQLSYGNLKYLFMSDAEAICEESRDWNDVDVLKVGHHGSNHATSQNFLNQVLPEIAIISVGNNNDYDLPSEKVLERLYGIGCEIFRTDLDGTLQIISDGEKNEVIKIDESFDGK